MAPNFVPWRESAWALLRERLAILVERCAPVEAEGGAPDAVAQAREKVGAVAATLDAGVGASAARLVV